jgi:acyl dehydratase
MEYDGRDKYGRYLEEFKVGDLYKHWPGRTITEADDTIFALVTMNQHPLHIDAAYAESTQFKQRVVAGPLVYAVVFGMTVSDVSGKALANLETESLTHTAPVFHGDTLYAETKVLETRESRSQQDRGIVTVETRGWNQRGQTVVTFRRKVMVPKRPAA